MVLIYSRPVCPYCDMAKNVLNAKNIPFTEKNAMQHAEEFKALAEKYNHRTVPMIFLNGEFIGGFSELSELNTSGELDKKIRGEES